MSCRFLVSVISQLARLGDFLVNYGGCLFLVFMIVSVYYVGLHISCRTTHPADYCSFMSNIGLIVVIEIVVNLTLFHYYSSHNCVSHWQRQACVADVCKNTISLGCIIDEEKGELDPVYLSRFCNLCGRDSPVRSHHCPICNICVLRKDHHCFITGACVGLGNQRYFITFLFWCFVGLLFSARFIVPYLYETSFATGNALLGFLYSVGPVAVIRWIIGFTNFLHAFVCTIFSFILVSTVASGGFFVMQIYYTCHGYTMYEYHSGVRDAFDGDGATIGERFRLIFGRYWILNFLFPLFWNHQLLTIEMATNLFRIRSKQL